MCSDGVVTSGWLCVEDANEVVDSVVFDVGTAVVVEVVVSNNVGDVDTVDRGGDGVVFVENETVWVAVCVDACFVGVNWVEDNADVTVIADKDEQSLKKKTTK